VQSHDLAWESLRWRLRLFACSSLRGCEYEDIVQSVLLKLLLKGRSPGHSSTFGLACYMAKCEWVDMLRARARLHFDPECVEEAAVDPGPVPVPVVDVLDLLPEELRSQLGRGGLQLLEDILGGARSNRLLAQRLGVDKRSIGRRRARIRKVLLEYIRNLQQDDPG